MEGMMHLMSNVLEVLPRYLEQSGIVPQYTMPSTLNINGIAERQN